MAKSRRKAAAKTRRRPPKLIVATTDQQPLSAAALAGAGSLAANISTVSPVQVDLRARFEQKLLQSPEEIRDAARALTEAIQDQIERLRSRNDDDTRDFIDFLEMLARGLSQLADALDQALAATPDQQPIFLGTAGKIAEQLKIGLFEYLEKDRAKIAGRSITIGLAVAGGWFLHKCGVDAAVAGTIKAIFRG
jgi:hypothetical protein